MLIWEELDSMITIFWDWGSSVRILILHCWPGANSDLLAFRLLAYFQRSFLGFGKALSKQWCNHCFKMLWINSWNELFILYFPTSCCFSGFNHGQRERHIAKFVTESTTTIAKIKSSYLIPELLPEKVEVILKALISSSPYRLLLILSTTCDY